MIHQTPPASPIPTAAASPHHERGQAALEVALSLPLLAVALLIIVQVALVVQARLNLEMIGRDAARAAAISPEPEAAARATTRHLAPDREIAVEVTLHPGPFAGSTLVEVQLVSPLVQRVPVIERFIAPRVLRTTVAMAREPP